MGPYSRLLSLGREKNLSGDDIPYATGPTRRLDVYRTEDGQNLPVIIFFFGGGWHHGDKAAYHYVGRALARAGFITVVPNYRLYPEVRFPDFLTDAALAVRWVADHIASYGGDPNQIYLIGYSSGAHIASLLTTDKRYLAQIGAQPPRGMIGISGPYDFRLYNQSQRQTFAGTPRARWLPIAHVDGSEPPMLLIQGTRDKIVDPGNTTRFAARIRAKGGRAKVRFYPVGHFAPLLSFSPLFRWLSPTLRDSVGFMKSLSTRQPSGAELG